MIDYYRDTINQTLSHHNGASPDARLVAEALMTGLAFIADRIEAVMDANIPDTLAGAVAGLDQIGEQIAEAIREAARR